jgi:hypothetical protein
MYAWFWLTVDTPLPVQLPPDAIVSGGMQRVGSSRLAAHCLELGSVTAVMQGHAAWLSAVLLLQLLLGVVCNVLAHMGGGSVGQPVTPVTPPCCCSGYWQPCVHPCDPPTRVWLTMWQLLLWL